MVKAKSFIEKFYVAFIGFLLYAPLLVLFVCSFNDSKSRTVWGGFTLHWYTDLFQNVQSIKTGKTFPIRIVIIAANAVLVGIEVYFVMCIGILE